MWSKKQVETRGPAIVLVLIVLAAAGLRLYRLSELMAFVDASGREFLAARDMALTGQWPPSGQGVAYLWLLGLALRLLGFDPVAGGLLGVLLGVLAVGGSFILARRYFDLKTAVVAGLMLATSPLAIVYSRLGIRTGAVPLAAVVYLAALLGLNEEKRPRLFWPMAAFGVLVQLEPAAAALVLLVPLILWLKKRRPRRQEVVWGAAGLGLGLLPQIMFDLTNDFQQLRGLAAGAASLAGRGSEGLTLAEGLREWLTMLVEYSQKFYSWWGLGPTVAILAVTAWPLMVINKLSERQKVLYAWVGLATIIFLLPGVRAEEGFPVLLAPMAILTAMAINKLSRKFFTQLVYGGLGLLFVYNAYFTVSQNYFLEPKLENNPFGTYGTALIEQVEVSDFILSKTDGAIELRSIGPGAEGKSKLDNYRYLVWWLERREVDESGQMVWIQPRSFEPKLSDTISYYFDTVVVSLPLNQIRGK